MKKEIILTALAAMALNGAAAAAPLWMRDAAISPDGSTIAFTYGGKIYTVGASGGHATLLTPGDSRAWHPVWSPDGKSIAYAGDRNGGADIYIMPSGGGESRRLTWHPANETPEAFTPDGKAVVFSAMIQDPASSAAFPTGSQPELYSVPVSGGRFTQMLSNPAVNVHFLPSGNGSFVYEDQKGSEDKWRKHHTSSIARDLWLYDAPQKRFSKLTDNPGEDRNPVVSRDGRTLYFLSERNGKSFNIYRAPVDNPSQAVAVTDFTTHPVRFLSMGANGHLAFGYNGELYTLDTATPGATPQKVVVEITPADLPAPASVAVAGPSGSGKVSPSGKQLAFTSRGEVFVTSIKYPSIKQITNTPAAETHVSWGKDDRTLYYDSQRDGARSNIYRATIRRDSDPDFSNATIIDETLLFPADGIERSHPNVSPDGKQIAYVRDRVNLWVADLATGHERQLTDTTAWAHRSGGFDVEWSPDSRHIVMVQQTPRQDPYGDIAVIDVATGKKNMITNSGYFDENPHWAFDGEGIIFFSERYGMRNHASWGSEYDVIAVFLTQDAYDRFMLSEEDYALRKDVEKAQKEAAKKKDDSKKTDKKGKKSDKKEDAPAAKAVPVFDFDNLADRTVRLTPNSADMSDAIITADGQTLYYLARFNDDYDLWKKDLRKGDVSKVASPKNGASQLMADTDDNIYLIGRNVKKMAKGSDSPKNVTTAARLKVDQARERQAMFDYVRNETRERFYDPSMNGVDWTGLTDNYARFLPHITNNADFADMLSELLGELNVSHTGGRFYGAGASDPAASLGLLYDMTYTGPGARVDEIVARGPFDRATTALRPGMIITAINGEALTDSLDINRALAGLSGKKTLVTFADGTGSTFDEVVLPVGIGRINSLLYDRWVRNRQQEVERLSDGRLGYVHLQSMSDDSFRRIYSKLMGEFKDREGVVIDTRWNGGGRLHEDIEVLLSGEKYLQQYVHGVKTAEMPSRRWNKPSIMLMGEANYSNAHGTPWVYNYKKMGKLVGMPVPGTMTSVNWITLQDPSLVFGVPVVGYKTAQGNYLENTQLEPDIRIANDPDVLATGRDQQLERAVEELLRQLDSK